MGFSYADGVGGDDLERPPHGHPTAAALVRCGELIPAWIALIREAMRGYGGDGAAGANGQRSARAVLPWRARGILRPYGNPSCARRGWGEEE